MIADPYFEAHVRLAVMERIAFAQSAEPWAMRFDIDESYDHRRNVRATRCTTMEGQYAPGR